MTVQIRRAADPIAYATTAAPARVVSGGPAAAARTGHAQQSRFDGPALAGAVKDVAQAAQKKDWLGVIKGVLSGIAGAIGGAAKMGGAIGQIATGKVAQTIGNIAGVLAGGVDVVRGGIQAAKDGNPGGVIQAIGKGLGAVSGLFGGAGDSLKQWGGKVEQAGSAVLAGQKAVEAVKGGDWGQAIKSGLDVFNGIKGLFG